MATDDRSLFQKLNMPVGKDVKEKLNTWLNDNVNIPLSERGHEDIGAGISAALSAAGELVIPEDLADVALSMVPGAKLVRAGKKVRLIKPAAEALDYAAIKKGEEVAAKTARELAEKKANTLVYDKSGKVNLKKPDMYDTELREIELKK